MGFKLYQNQPQKACIIIDLFSENINHTSKKTKSEIINKDYKDFIYDDESIYQSFYRSKFGVILVLVNFFLWTFVKYSHSSLTFIS